MLELYTPDLFRDDCGRLRMDAFMRHHENLPSLNLDRITASYCSSGIYVNALTKEPVMLVIVDDDTILVYERNGTVTARFNSPAYARSAVMHNWPKLNKGHQAVVQAVINHCNNFLDAMHQHGY